VASLYRDLTAILRAAGCEMRRQDKGSHEVWFSPITRKTFSVPANIRSHRLANEILKQAGVAPAF
jgi:hypothetical protein